MSKSFYAAKYLNLFSFHDPLSLFGIIFWDWAEPDRYDILNMYSPFNFAVDKSIPLPNLKSPKVQNLRDICIDTAYSIILKAKKNNKKIAILWSGGVDSTCAISSFLLAGAKPEELIILCAQDSIQEFNNGYFMLKNDFNIKVITYEWRDSFKVYESLGTDVYFISGWCADQLFGSNVNLYYPDHYKNNWKDSVRIFVNDALKRISSNLITKDYVKISEKEINKCIDLFDKYAYQLGFKLKYTCEFLWLFNFAIKWSHVSRDLRMTLTTEEQRKNAINFYEGIAFQEWSVSNFDELHKHNQTLEVASYKRPLKEIIYEVFKDEHYLKYKGKVNSWKGTYKINRYSGLTIWDSEEGIKYFNIVNINNGNSTEPRLIENMNKRVYAIDYLKDSFDKERYKKELFW